VKYDMFPFVENCLTPYVYIHFFPPSHLPSYKQRLLKFPDTRFNHSIFGFRLCGIHSIIIPNIFNTLHLPVMKDLSHTKTTNFLNTSYSESVNISSTRTFPAISRII
jgi:hypothetical protein